MRNIDASVLFESDEQSLNIRKQHCNFSNNMNSLSGSSIIIIIVIASVVNSVHSVFGSEIYFSTR